MPELLDDKLVFSLYSNGGYKIAMIDNFKPIDTEYIGYKNTEYFEPSNIQISNHMSYTDSSTEYETSLTEFHFVPRLMFDYETIKYGFYGFTEDMVGHLSLFGGFTVNELSDVDAMIMLEYKKLYPTLYTNLFWASRNTEQDFDYYTVDSLLVDNIDIENEVDYHLFFK